MLWKNLYLHRTNCAILVSLRARYLRPDFGSDLRSTVGAPRRRAIYTSSLEAHIDRLHAQLLEYARSGHSVC